MHILNTDYKIEFQNNVLLDLVGDQVGRYCYEVYKNRTEPCEECLMQKAAETDTVLSDIEVCVSKGRFFRKNYTTFKDTDGKKKCVLLFNDITEIRAYQAKKVRTSQLASIGELAAGVAHEINNPINGMINYAQLLIDNINADEETNGILTRIIKEGTRVADIVSNLLIFARQGDDDNQIFLEIYVQDIIEDSLTLVRHQLMNDGINITIKIQPDVPAVWVHPQQLEQVFINLLSNARYALNEKFKGKDRNKKLAIKISTVEMVGTTYVRTSIKDFGIGIPSDIIDHVYDPFFSTKKLGEGTGLGLSISRSLVKKFKGFLRIKSDPGNYTNIMVDIPIYNGSQNNDQ
jgi:signal transduction histidine kinase